MPMEMDTTNTVFSLPMKGRVVMASAGRSHRGVITSSKPNTLPNSRPKMVERNRSRR